MSNLGFRETVAPALCVRSMRSCQHDLYYVKSLCWFQGSLEFMKECTTIEYPFSLYNAEQDKTEIGYATWSTNSASCHPDNSIAMYGRALQRVLPSFFCQFQPVVVFVLCPKVVAFIVILKVVVFVVCPKVVMFVVCLFSDTMMRFHASVTV